MKFSLGGFHDKLIAFTVGEEAFNSEGEGRAEKNHAIKMYKNKSNSCSSCNNLSCLTDLSPAVSVPKINA